MKTEINTKYNVGDILYYIRCLDWEKKKDADTDIEIYIFKKKVDGIIAHIDEKVKETKFFYHFKAGFSTHGIEETNVATSTVEVMEIIKERFSCKVDIKFDINDYLYVVPIGTNVNGSFSNITLERIKVENIKIELKNENAKIYYCTNNDSCRIDGTEVLSYNEVMEQYLNNFLIK